MNDKLSLPERSELKELEAVVDRFKCMFPVTAEALLKIKSGCLYRDTHETFEKYVHERFGFKLNYANRLLAAGEVREQLKNVPIGTTVVPRLTTESQYRELTNVPDDELEAVVEAAAKKAGDQPITAKVIREAKDEVLGESKPKPKPAPDWKHLRDTGKSKAESLLRTIDDLQGAKKSRSHAVAVDYAKKIITVLEGWGI